MRETVSDRRFRVITICVLFILISAVAAVSADWLAEFEEICGKTNDAESLEAEEIKALIDKTDKLLPVIEASSDPKKKVYIIRLQKCRNFFTYMLDLKQGG